MSVEVEVMGLVAVTAWDGDIPDMAVGYDRFYRKTKRREELKRERAR